MPEYESGLFDPPAPIVRVGVRGGNNAVFPNVPLLIDSGADVSVIPQEVAIAVGASVRSANRPVEFYDGTQTSYTEAELAVQFGKYTFHGWYLVAPFAYGILGRNVLNQLMLTLNGPLLTWSL